MPSKQPIPQEAVDKDQRLERSHDKASEALAKHRWHWTLDESNPDRVSVRAYARAVGRHRRNIQSHADGYAEWLRVASSELATPSGRTLHDCIRLSFLSAETQQIAEAIAEGEGSTPGEVAQGRNRQRLREIEAHARERAERRGTDPIDEARDIAVHHRQSREMDARHREQQRERRTLRYVEIEGDLANAQRRLMHALTVAEGVGFDDEELELLRDSIAKVRAVLDLIDLRMAGTPDIDWDAELAKLGGGS